MSNGVEGQWAIDLNIGGYPIYVDLDNIFHEVTIRSNIHQDLPTISFSAKDKNSTLIETVGLCDGMAISCAMNDGSVSLPSPTQFLAMGNPSLAPGEGAHTVSQTGSLAKPDWNRQIWDKAVKGHSGDVLQQMLSAAGLTGDIDQTDDMMTWLPKGVSMASYARFLAEKAWVGTNSAIVTAMTEGGVFKFKDLSKIIASNAVKTFGFGDGQIPYLDQMFSSKGKLYNAARGYGSTTHQDPGTGVPQEFNKITAGLMSGFSGIGSIFQTASGLLGQRFEHSPIDSGNTHAKYREATHQNRRIKGLYSEDVILQFDRMTGVELHDKVQYNSFNLYSGEALSNYTGGYIVTAITRQIMANRYFETLTITSNGQNSGS